MQGESHKDFAEEMEAPGLVVSRLVEDVAVAQQQIGIEALHRVAHGGIARTVVRDVQHIERDSEWPCC